LPTRHHRLSVESIAGAAAMHRPEACRQPASMVGARPATFNKHFCMAVAGIGAPHFRPGLSEWYHLKCVYGTATVLLMLMTLHNAAAAAAACVVHVATVDVATCLRYTVTSGNPIDCCRTVRLLTGFSALPQTVV